VDRLALLFILYPDQFGLRIQFHYLWGGHLCVGSIFGTSLAKTWEMKIIMIKQTVLFAFIQLLSDDEACRHSELCRLVDVDMVGIWGH